MASEPTSKADQVTAAFLALSEELMSRLGYDPQRVWRVLGDLYDAGHAAGEVVSGE